MDDRIPDLWPPTFGSRKPTPLGVLREQAHLLGTKTEGRVRGEVQTVPSLKGNEFLHIFRIVAPGLGNYAFDLFSVSHDLNLNPVKVLCDLLPQGEVAAPDQQSFTQALGDVLRHEKSVQVINALLSQLEPVGVH